jgi:trimethylguanosine synthase
LFSKFEEGIEIDEESWYSVIPEQVALHLKERLKHKKITKIFEPFSGIGGIAIHLCDSFQEYIVNDID